MTANNDNFNENDDEQCLADMLLGRGGDGRPTYNRPFGNYVQKLF